MFIPTLLSQGTPEQQAKWLPMSNRLQVGGAGGGGEGGHLTCGCGPQQEAAGAAWAARQRAPGVPRPHLGPPSLPSWPQISGTYAQTELGHGTFVRGLQTVAVYDEASRQFVVHSPSLESTKWWPGGLGKTATHVRGGGPGGPGAQGRNRCRAAAGGRAVVALRLAHASLAPVGPSPAQVILMARLFAKGQDYGPHAFVVQVRFGQLGRTACTLRACGTERRRRLPLIDACASCVAALLPPLQAAAANPLPPSPRSGTWTPTCRCRGSRWATSAPRWGAPAAGATAAGAVAARLLLLLPRMPSPLPCPSWRPALAHA